MNIVHIVMSNLVFGSSLVILNAVCFSENLKIRCLLCR